MGGVATAKQKAAQARFARAAKQAKREGVTGKAFSRRVGAILKGSKSRGRSKRAARKSAKASAPRRRRTRMARHKKGGGRRKGFTVTPKNVLLTAAAAFPLIDYGRAAVNSYNIDKDVLHAMTGVTMKGGFDKTHGIAQGTRLATAYLAPKLINALVTKVAPAPAKRILNAKLARI